MIARTWPALVSLAVCAGCSPTGPDTSLTGAWSARGIGHSLTFDMSLRQTGDEISGVACGYSSGVVIFSGVPVNGDYPRVRFVVSAETAGSCCPALVGAAFDRRSTGPTTSSAARRASART
jgi:hypothetical protein